MKVILKVEPVAKGRPKTRFFNGQAVTYTPTKTKDAQDAIKAILLEKGIGMQFPPHVPLKMVVTFYRTKSIWLKKKETKPFRKWDLDNAVKLLTDSINGILIEDDAAITTCLAKKRWTDRKYGYIVCEITEDRGK